MNNLIQMAMAQPQVVASGKTAGEAAAADPMAMLMNFMPIILILVLFWFLFIGPQRKQQKQHEELLKSLKKGDEIITTGGIFGSVNGFNDREGTVYIKLGENIKIEMQRSSIAGLRHKKDQTVISSTPSEQK